jgi:prepilin-type N-terminal cleavage/methylation domain-containing protein
MKNQPHCRPRPSQAFTLIELLVVIAIIGILAALIVGVGPAATAKMRTARAQAELQSVISAIGSYQAKKGVYPPDNSNSTTNNPLYYELTGAVLLNNGNFQSRLQETLTANQVQSIFNMGGFINSATDVGELQNYFPAMKVSQRAAFVDTATKATYTLLGCQVPGPVKGGFNPFHYVSSNPVHNQNGFDLWVDIMIRGKTNRISNWSPDPEVVNDWSK